MQSTRGVTFNLRINLDNVEVKDVKKTLIDIIEKTEIKLIYNLDQYITQ